MKDTIIIKRREKLSYALVNLGNMPIMTLISTYLLIFYTDVCGLNPAAVATLFVIARFADALNDPFFGFLLDQFPVTKMGKFRPVLFIGSIIGGLNFLLLWYGPLLMPSVKLLIAYVSYLLLGITFTIMDISLNSLLPVMTESSKERNTLASIKGVVVMVGALVLSIVAPIIISVSANQAQGYMVLIAAATIVVIGGSCLGILGVRERVIKKAEKSYTFQDLLRIFVTKPVFITFLAALCYSLGSNMFSAAGTYFYTYIFGDLTWMGLASMISMLGVIPGTIIGGILSNKFSKKRIYVVGFIMACLAIPVRFLGLSNVLLLCVSMLLYGLGTGFIMTLVYSIQADNTDYVEKVQETRAEAAVASLSSFATKAGSGIGGALPGYILAAAGYSATAASQSTSVIIAIVISALILPATMYALGGIIFGLNYKLEKD